MKIVLCEEYWVRYSNKGRVILKNEGRNEKESKHDTMEVNNEIFEGSSKGLSEYCESEDQIETDSNRKQSLSDFLNGTKWLLVYWFYYVIKISVHCVTKRTESVKR